MSVFAGRASQISAMEPRIRKSQFRAGNGGRLFRFVSRHGLPAKRRDALAVSFCAISPQGETDWCRDDIAQAQAILAGLFLCTAFSRGPRPARPLGRDDRARQGADRRRRLRQLPYRRSLKTVRRGQAHRHPVRRHLFAEPDAGSRDRARRLERRRLRPRPALRRGARRLALLPGLPLSELHQS